MKLLLSRTCQSKFESYLRPIFGSRLTVGQEPLKLGVVGFESPLPIQKKEKKLYIVEMVDIPARAITEVPFESYAAAEEYVIYVLRGNIGTRKGYNEEEQYIAYYGDHYIDHYGTKEDAQYAISMFNPIDLIREPGD